MIRLVLAAAALLTVLPAHAQSWQKGTLQGQTCAVAEKKTVVVKSVTEWKSLWKQVAPQADAAPQVDFSREMVVGVFLGEKPRAGYKVEVVIQNSATDPKKLVVFYREVPPAKDSFGAEVISHPYALVKVPIHAAVDFEVNGRVGILPGEGAQQAPKSISPDQTFHIEGVVNNLKAFSGSFDN